MKTFYSYQQVCNILCEACKLKIPMDTHVFKDKSYRTYHIVNEKDISCNASEWRKSVKPRNGEFVNIIVKKEIK